MNDELNELKGFALYLFGILAHIAVGLLAALTFIWMIHGFLNAWP